MNKTKEKKENLIDLENIEQTFRLKGQINRNRELQKEINVFEQVGLTTSINSVVKDLEQNSNIKILSPFAISPNSPIKTPLSKFGTITSNDLENLNMSPAVKRIKFVNSFLMKFLILAIIINFVIILVLGF